MSEIAILMAAGMGTRMRPVTEKTPKPLVKIGSEPLIETIIRSLKRRNIKHIYIVVGYLKEQFDYLVKKYNNVSLIESSYFETINNISSIYVASEIMGKDNCFICEADLYINNKEIFEGDFNKSCYFGKMVEGYSDDWIFETKNGRITHVGKGGEDTYNMVGVSYFTAKDAKKIAHEVRRRWNTDGYEQLFWDEIVDTLLNEMEVIINPVGSDDIIEIDTVKELNEVRKKYGEGEK